ncbi:microtubule-associated protein futsch [Phymastichus coffea]|uniref:microtubule-associated protein futsch n=1 Tax=Phymastichus coffea TaxID=108790 RepID=UPI00273A851F|nr:microtubule-associated protein futsch [Phymastichus coffea]
MTSVAAAGEAGGGAAAGGGESEGTSATAATSAAPAPTTAEQAPSAGAASAPAAQQPQPQPQQQHPPPSPLSGCYLLVVLPEPHTAQHKDLILNRLAKGFLSWDKDSCHVDLEKELQALVAQSPEGEEARNGERLIQYATENLVTEVLIYPQSNTLLQCIRNLLASFTKHRHIIHAGYTFGGNGSWILQDGTFSLADFLDAFSEHEVQRVLRAYENSVTVDIHCAGVGDWTTSRLSKEACTRACRVRVNPDDVLTAGVPAITSFVGYIGQYLIPQTLDQLMEPSDVVGNIRFSHPTLYVFPGGQGDAALFGINGFNMLVDGGFARKACFWDFVRHLDRLDAVLVTRINNSNVGGMSSVIRKKKETHVYPQIGHFFCNLVERKHSNSPDGDKDIDPLILNLIDVGQEMMLNLRHINLRPHPCYRDPEPINLYHKVGHGTLDMYVLSPSKDSREVREFMAKWNASDSKLFAGSHRKDSNSLLFPVQNLVSICALLVWQPANPEDTITRILFPGSTPQHKIFEGFERLKHLEFLKRPVCTAKSLSPSTSLATLKEKATILKPKLGSIERETKRLAEMRKEKKDLSENKAVKKDSGIDDATPKIAMAKPAPSIQQQKPEPKAKKVVENKKIESELKESKLIENGIKETRKEIKKIEKSEETKKTDIVKAETEKTAPVKESKTQKVETKKKETKEVAKPIAKLTRPDSTIKPSPKPVEKKPKPAGEKKDIMKPSPTTPKKSINGTATKTEITKTVTKNIKVVSKASSAVPAKSAKDANNRMVVEQKNIELSSKSAIDSKGKSKTATTTSATNERKPVTRRAKPLSPSKARLPISPAKSAKSTPSSVKSEKDAVIRKIKGGTTDSSAVSTPSGIDILESGNKLTDRNLTEKSEDMSMDSIESKVLADLKEEREVVEEIEAVLQKAERIEGTLKKFNRDDELAVEAADKKDDDVTEEDVTAELDDVPKKISRKESQELTEEDEYLIVEKEEIFTEDSVQSGDTEQKHHLDEVESEKPKIRLEDPPQELEEHEDEKDIDEKKDEIPEKKLVKPVIEKEVKKSVDLSPENKEILEEELKHIIVSATEAVQKTEERDDSARKDSEDITKEPSSISPEKFDSPGKQDVDRKESIPEKLEESQERISTLESGATTTAPTLPDDERVPLDEIKEEMEKHVSEEIKEKELVKEKEIIPQIPSIAPKPEVKILDVKPVIQGIARDIVKTPDEVADLPVHEEVDPKLYRMDDIEKYKDMKISPQETKEPPTPPSKEKDKGVFSFFGKVADTFEKGLDKLTKKARRDSEKDGEDKSSKSSSPKEPKPQDKVLLEEVDMNKVFPKVGKREETLETLEKAKQEISDAISGIDATTALLQKDIKELKSEEKEFGFVEPIQYTDKPQKLLEDDVKQENVNVNEALPKVSEHEQTLDPLEKAKQEINDAISGISATTALLQEDMKELKISEEEFGFIEPIQHVDKSQEFVEKEIKKEVEDIEDVEGLMEEASKKFKNVKDSLQDSLESLEDKFDGVKKVALEEKDTVKDMLTGVAEKLEDIADIDVKEPEKVKFTIPESDDENDTGGVVRDFKEAVRDVAEVLAGTAGIEIEKGEKTKDVEKIVKEVAEVLKEDTFLPEEVLSKSIHDKKQSLGDVHEQIALSKPVIEEIARDVKEQVEEFLQKESIELSQPEKVGDVHDTIEEPFIKSSKGKELVSSPVKDHATSLQEAKILCEDMLKSDIIRDSVVELQSDTRADVLDSGLEEMCIKKIAKRETYEETTEDNDKIIVEPEISFQQNLSPAKAELVTVTPGSTPTSPKLATEAEFSDLSSDYKDMINRDANLEDIIEEFIVKKKHKITKNIIEYIVIVKRVPKEKVINIIQEIIIKYKIPRESVADKIENLRSNDNIPIEKWTKIENDITNEYLNKNKKINSSIVDEIAKSNIISKRIVIEIIEEIIVRKKFSRESVFDISDESYFTIMNEDLDKVPEREVQKQDFLVDVSSIVDSIDVSNKSIHMPTSAEDVGDEIVDGFVSISSKDAVEAFLQQEKDNSQKDDFEAVEQEYKVRDVSTASPKTIVEDQKTKETEEISECMSDVTEVDEKFVRETVEKSTKKDYVSENEKKIKDAKKDDEDTSHDVDISEVSEVETKEKYLDEAKEKTSDYKEFLKSVKPIHIAQSTLSSVEHHTKSLNDEKDVQESVSVRRMVVTASSEDGGQETEICPTGTITFTKVSGLEDAKSDVLNADQIKRDTTQSPDSLQSGDASPAESVFSKSPTEKTSPHDLEFVLSKETVIKEASEKVFHKTETVEVTQSIDDKDIKHEILISDMPSTSPVENIMTDTSKSPNDDRESHEKEISPEKSGHDSQYRENEIKDRSKSPSVEKQSHEKEDSPEKSIYDNHEIEIKDRLKSPSTEKKEEKELVPEKSIGTDLAKPQSTDIIDRSKSPSLEKETNEKETSPQKFIHDDHRHHAIEVKDISKSASAEEEIKKESSPEKSTHDDHDHHTIEVSDRSKSPSVEKEDKTESQDLEVGDRSKSSSVEKESYNKEASPGKLLQDDHVQHAIEVIDRSKSPSTEKESHDKEASIEKSIHDDHDRHVIEDKDRSKSPSVEKEDRKESSLNKSSDIDHLQQHEKEVKDTSESPNVEKEVSSSKTIHDYGVDIEDSSKSSSAEREEKKESSTEKSVHDDHDPHKVEVNDISKSSTLDNKSHKEASPEKSIHEDHTEYRIDAKNRSKSPSTEKEDKIESLSGKSVHVDHAKPYDVNISDRSISPNLEKEVSLEKPVHDDHVTDTKDRSKSPSVEKQSHEKEASIEKSIHDEHVHHEIELKDRSKSPSSERQGEKELYPEKSVDTEHTKSHDIDKKDSSKFPNVERESLQKESTPEKSIHDDHVIEHHEIEVKDISKSLNIEKEEKNESSLEKSLESDHIKTQDVDIKGRSKSPSVEKESNEKEASPPKSIYDDEKHHTVDVKDGSKSPSVEREDKKELQPQKSSETSHIQSQDADAKERSKSPSVEKEFHGKETSSEKSICHDGETQIKDGSKSLSLEKETLEKEGSSKKSLDAEHICEEQNKDKLKSSSIEETTDIMEDKHVDDSATMQNLSIKDGSKSPSTEKEDKTEERIIIKDISKSPSVEKESTNLEKIVANEGSSERSASSMNANKGEEKDEAQTTRVEKEITLKQDTVDFIHFEKTQYSAADTATDKLVEPESSSTEKALLERKLSSSQSPNFDLADNNKDKETLPDKIVTDLAASKPEVTTQIVSKSRSSSIIADTSNKESMLVKSNVFEELEESMIVSAVDATEQSKSLSVEQDISYEKNMSERTSVNTDTRSKSPSVEKDVGRRDSVPKKDIDDNKQLISHGTLGQHEDISHSSSVTADSTKDSEPSSKSRSGSIQSVIDHGVPSSSNEKDKLSDEKSRTGSISESAVSEVPTHQSKSPSPEKVDVISEQYSDTFMEKARLSLISDKFDEDSLDRTKSPSVLSDRSDEKDMVDRSKSPSVAGDKFDVEQIDDPMKEHVIEEKPSAPSLSEIIDKNDSEKSKSVSPVNEKIHAESTNDRKASVTSVESRGDDKGKDRSRSHSLFDTGDKTPLVRSRAASLYDDKLVEKVSLLEHRKDSTGHGKGIFEEEHEFRSSQESFDDIHKDIPRRDSKETDFLSDEKKQAIENYILNEYIRKNKVITLTSINEITTIYKVDRYVVIKIVNELITSLKLKQEKILEFDEDEHDEADQKLFDVEENLMNYINEEFVLKKKKITSKIIDEIASSKSVPRPLVILVIENIILSRNLRRESVVDFDLCESQDLLKKDMGVGDPASKSKTSAEIIPEKTSVKEVGSESKSPSVSPGPGPSISATSERPEPRIDEEVTITENKREEIESLIVGDYVDRGIKINEAILENIIARTLVPKYIIIEIIQEIIVKKLLLKNVVVDEIIFSDDDLDETPQKLEYEESSQSREYEEHSWHKSMPYSEFESPFHKAFMEGMTEIRTTHITTLSGKSTPDLGQQEATPEPSSEVTSTIIKTITSTSGKSEPDSKDKVIGEHDQEDETSDRVVILKTTQITTYPEDEQEIVREFVQRQSLSGPLEIHKIDEETDSRVGTREVSSIESKIDHDGGEHAITEIMTTKLVKTIIRETEMDQNTTTTNMISETPSETTTFTTHSKITTKDTHETIIPTTVAESHVSSSSSKTVVTSTVIDTDKSIPDRKDETDQSRKSLTGKDLIDHTVSEQVEQSVSPVIRDLISDDRSYSGKSSPDVSLPKDIAYGDSTGKSTPDLSMSPLIRDGVIQSHISGRSTPDKRSENRSRTATPEGFRAGEVIRTIITTTRTISDDGELITTTQEVTETTNEKGETVVLTTKTDVTVDEPLAESLTDEARSADAQRVSSPSSDLVDKDKDPTSPRSDLSSGHSRAATEMWESSEERHTYSDKDQSSPLFSSSPHHQDPHLSIKEETAKPSAEADFSSSAMSSSFYGQLPEELAHFTSTITQISESHADQDFTFRKLTVEKEYAGGYVEKDTKKYIDEADLDFEKALTVAPGSSKDLAKPGDSESGDVDDRKDPLASWGSPLKLPSPKAPRKFNLRSPIQPTSSADLSPDSLNFDVINDWGEPMRLPSPAPTANEFSNKGSPGTPKKERGEQARKVMSENIKNKKRSESPSKNDKKYKNAKNKVQPVYVDLTYVSHHGNSFYTALDFFKKVRARYYVFSGTEPSREVYDALLEAKKTWEDKDLEVTLIPTYDTDTLGYWVADNEEALAANHIDLSPSASRCTINLQDHETSCSAYRLEF